jgi:cytosine/uracil/thiamine/allantoin permease
MSAQAPLIMTLAGLSFVAMLSLNGQPGLKYGIRFRSRRARRMPCAARRSSFLRAAPAIVCSGIGTWIAALAVYGILKTLTGLTATLAPYVYFRQAAGPADLARVQAG